MTGLDERIEVCAAGDAAWQATAYRSLGAPWAMCDNYAAGTHVPHPYLLGAITLSRHAVVPDTVPGPIRDSWGILGAEKPSPLDAQ